MKKKLILSFLLTLSVALCALFGACSLFGKKDDGSSDKDGAELIKVGSAAPDGNGIFLFIGAEEWYDLVKAVEVSEGATIKIYYDEDCTDEIKDYYISTTSLPNGNNIFYIKVTSGNARTTNTYKLTAYKSYGVAVFFYDGDQFLERCGINTGEQFTPSYVPELVGYTFEGWHDSENNAFSSGVVWESINLYVSKKPIAYKATLDANGGEQPKETEVPVDYDSVFTLPVAERYGYDFAGWYEGETRITDEKGNALDVWKFTKNTSLTAKWTPRQYRINLVNEDASAGSVSGDWSVLYGYRTEITATPEDGYTFVGWYDEDGGLITKDTRYEFEVSGDRTFTAKWGLFTLTIQSEAGGRANRMYAVKFDLNGFKGTAPETQYVSPFRSLTYPPKPPEQTVYRNVYIFRGWFTKPVISKTDEPYDFSAEVNSDMTLYAGWYEFAKTDRTTVLDSLISFDLNGAVSGNRQYLYFCAFATGEYTLSYESDKTDLTKGTSLAVYNKSTGTQLFSDTYNDTDYHTQNISVKAGNVYCIELWRERSGSTDFRVSVGINDHGLKPQEGGVAPSPAPETPVRAGTELVLEATADDGYEFMGWYDEEGTLVSTELICTVTMPYSTKVFTAKWRPIP